MPKIKQQHKDIVQETGGTPLQGGGDVKRLFGLMFSMLSLSCRTMLSVAACMGRLILDTKSLQELVGTNIGAGGSNSIAGTALERDLKEAERSGLLKFVPSDYGMSTYMDEDLGFDITTLEAESLCFDFHDWTRRDEHCWLCCPWLRSSCSWS